MSSRVWSLTLYSPHNWRLAFFSYYLIFQHLQFYDLNCEQLFLEQKERSVLQVKLTLLLITHSVIFVYPRSKNRSACARDPPGGEQVTASCFSHLLVDSHRHRALITFEERGDTQRNSLLSSYICTTSFCHFRPVSLDTQAYTGAPGHPTTPQRPPQVPKDTPHLVRKRRRWAGLPLHFIASCQISTHR